jgi:hypothetical protein
VLAKGLMEDLTLEQWFCMVGGMGVRRPIAEVRARTLAGAIECLRNGITTVQDQRSLVFDRSTVDDVDPDRPAHARSPGSAHKTVA